MINRVPVISSNTGGIPEVNIHGLTGFLSDVGDVADMTKNALIILENEEVLAQFKENAYKTALKFDIKNILPLYEAVYEKAYNTTYNNSI